MAMLHEEITQKVLEACFEVANELGAGFLESVYQNALLIAFQEKQLRVAAQRPIDVQFRGQVVGHFCADFLINDRVIVEIKAVNALLPEHQAQVINYLKAAGIEIGLLVNFGKQKLEYKRLYKSPSLKILAPE
jgi:GxxExxY protein